MTKYYIIIGRTMGLTKPRAAQIYNLDYKQATRVVAVTNIALAGGAPSSVDGVSLSLNDRVLVTAQTTGSQNGLYYVTTVGSGSNGTWARTSDANDTGEIESGMIVMVTEGLIYADTQWKLITNDPITIGTTTLTFTQNYSANSISGGTSNVTVYSNSNVSISSAGTANVLTVSSTGVVVTGTTSVSGNIIPTANAIYSLGSATNYFKSLYVAGNSIYLGNVTLGTTSGVLTVNSSNVVTADAGGNTSTTGNITGGNILTNGLISAASTITGTSHLGAVVSVTGNITGNYFIGNGSQLTGITAAGGSSITNGTSNVVVAASGNVTVGVAGTVAVATFATTGIYAPGLISATGSITSAANVSAATHVGTAVSVTGSVTAASVVGGVITGTSVSVTGAVTGASLVGTITTASQTNITSVGTLSSLSVTGNATVGNISATNHTGTTVSVTGTQTAASTVGGVITGSSVSVTGNVTALNHFGTNTSVTGTQTAASTVGGVITGSSVSVTGTVTGLSFTGAGTGLTGTAASLSIGGSAASATTAGTVTTAAQSNITSVGTLTSLSVTNSTVGSWITQTTGGSLGGTAGNQVLLSRWNTTDANQNYLELTETRTSTGTSWTTSGTRFQEKIDATWMGFIQFNGTNTNGGITFGTGTTTVGPTSIPDRIYIDSAGNFYPAAANAQTLGSSTNWWSTVYGKAVQAQYADLAEMYSSDIQYTPGTVVVFGGTNEITIATENHDTRVAGIVSTNPAYLMNSAIDASMPLEVALVGRVPCSVVGTVRKGDRLVASGTPGVAQALNVNLYQPGCIIGKALEEYNSTDPGVIEVAVGRF